MVGMKMVTGETVWSTVVIVRGSIEPEGGAERQVGFDRSDLIQPGMHCTGKMFELLSRCRKCRVVGSKRLQPLFSQRHCPGTTTSLSGKEFSRRDACPYKGINALIERMVSDLLWHRRLLC